MSFYFEAFNPLAQWKKGGYPLSPQVAVRVATYRTESGGAVIVGPYLATESEIDEVVNNLFKELEGVRKDAKRQLKATLSNHLGAKNVEI